MNFKITLTVFLSLFINIKAATVASYNIRNFDYDQRSQTPTNKNQLLKTLKSLNADLIAVQEIREKSEFNRFIQNNFNSFETAFSECGGSHAQHLGFVFNKKKYQLLRLEEDMRTVNPRMNSQRTACNGSRPVLIAKFKDLSTNKVFHALSVHLKSGGQSNSIKKRFKQLAIISNIISELKKNGHSSFMIMGDFNSTEYSLRGTHYKKFKKIMRDMNMRDLSEDLKCSSYWWGGVDDGVNYPSMLDHVIVSPDLYRQKSQVMSHCQKLRCNETYESEMGVSFDEVSDHCPQVALTK